MKNIQNKQGIICEIYKTENHAETGQFSCSFILYVLYYVLIPHPMFYSVQQSHAVPINM